MFENDLLLFLFIQLVGFCGYSLYVASSFQKSRFMLLAIEAAGCGVVALHWLMMNMETIAWMNFVYVYLSVVSLAVVKYPKARIFLALSIPMIFVLTAMSWEGSVSGMIAIVATGLGVVATLLAVLSKFCADMFKLRALSLISSTLWVTCGLFAGSVAQIVACGAFAYGHYLGLKKLAAERDTQATIPSMADRLTQVMMPQRRVAVRVTARENLRDRQRPLQ